MPNPLVWNPPRWKGRPVATVATAGAIAVTSCSGPPPTSSSLSPDGSFRVDLVEVSAFLDRNFRIELTEVSTERSRTIFESPDEGRPIGTEHFVWSADGSRLLLLGRHFYVTDGILASGEQAYLMMDITTGRIWCNASQQNTYPNFGLPQLRSIEWLRWAPE